MKNVLHWIKGLVGALIGGAANSITVMIVDPVNFNLDGGFKKLGIIAMVGGILSAAMYLKQSPVPGGGANESRP